MITTSSTLLYINVGRDYIDAIKSIMEKIVGNKELNKTYGNVASIILKDKRKTKNTSILVSNEDNNEIQDFLNIMFLINDEKSRIGLVKMFNEKEIEFSDIIINEFKKRSDE